MSIDPDIRKKIVLALEADDQTREALSRAIDDFHAGLQAIANNAPLLLRALAGASIPRKMGYAMLDASKVAADAQYGIGYVENDIALKAALQMAGAECVELAPIRAQIAADWPELATILASSNGARLTLETYKAIARDLKNTDW